MAHEPITIFIDHKQYKAPTTPMTAEALRALPNPPIASDLDLWLTVPGPADDDLITDGESVPLKDGMHFYTAPRSINPGGDYAAT